jgi:DNA repair exonuclease SbcCD ATPase subunit
MYLKKVILNDYKCFSGKHEFDFAKINLVSGENGSGKSTLALQALLFTLFGYSEVTLPSLPTRNLTSPNTYVQVELEYLGVQYTIKRSIPTAINIYIDGVEVTLSNNSLKQQKLEEIFQNVDFFRKFRMIDIKDSINILEQGPQALRKTLVDFDNSININEVRTNFLGKKSIREQYNKDIAVIYTHYPSSNRYAILNEAFDEVSSKLMELDRDLRNNETLFYELSNKKTRIEVEKTTLADQKNTIITEQFCPVCHQQMPINIQKEILTNVSDRIIALNEKLSTIIDELQNQKEVIENVKQAKLNQITHKDKLTRLIHRLDGRLKQKDFIWTTKDVELMKRCISELDGFTTFYITEKLRCLEPLINNILNKLGFHVKFNINDKNNFDITLIRNGVEYKYKDLSNGQRLFVTIAFQLALLMEKNEIGLIIADEGFSSLDQKNLELVFDLFKNTNFQLVAIVHRFATNDINVRNIKV